MIVVSVRGAAKPAEVEGELVAEVKLKDPDFGADLNRVKQIPLWARVYSAELRAWTIRNPERWEHLVKELGVAVRDYRRQLRMF